MSNTVKYFHSDMAGAPVLSGTAGAMIGVLDACLVNGWGSGTVDSVVIASGVATVTRGAGHPFEPDMVVEIAGATVTGGTINGQFKIASVAGNTYTFPVPGIPNQTATGTITHKIASLGFTKPYSGTNLAAYRSSDVTGTQFYLRIDDTGTQNARAVGYEAMTAISTGDRAFPLESQLSGGYFWPKSGAADSNPRRWVLFGNSKFFMLCVRWSDNTGNFFSATAGFGDFLNAGSTDAYRAFINGAAANPVGSSPGALTLGIEMDTSTTAGNNMRIARSFTAVGSPVAGRLSYGGIAQAGSTSARSGDTSNTAMFPNGADGGIYASPMLIGEVTTECYRGRVPGLYAFPQKVGSSVFSHREKVSPVSGLSGRNLMVINSNNGCFGVDITGPWE